MNRRPALLASYAYLDGFLRIRDKIDFRDWVLDSGAFSVKAGTKLNIDLRAYTERCKELLANDPKLVEVYALDVIGDWKASIKNAEFMWEQGVPAVPTVHVNEPEEALLHLARHYPKIAVGGAVGMRAKSKLEWARQCFARVWPKRIHGFGYGGERAIMALPWHSVDATNWEQGPTRFGRWERYGRMSVRGSGQMLRGEVEHYLRIEARAQAKWRKAMAELPAGGVSLRLGCQGNVRAESEFALSASDSRALRDGNPTFAYRLSCSGEGLGTTKGYVDMALRLSYSGFHEKAMAGALTGKE